MPHGSFRSVMLSFALESNFSIFVCLNKAVLMIADNMKHTVTMAELISLNAEKSRYVRLAYGYVCNMDDAEDIFQDSLLQLLRGMDHIYVSDIKLYFATVIRNACLRHLKRKVKSDSLSDPVLQAHISRLEADTENLSVYADLFRHLKNCRSALTELTIDVFEAKRFEGMSYKEISRIFGITERRANHEIQKALKIFREEFKDYLPSIILLMFFILRTAEEFNLFRI